MGVGQHYQGTAGQRYFEWQRRNGASKGAINARKFAEDIPPDSVLVDFGCGGGFLLEQLRAREKKGIEPNQAARESALARGLNVVASASELEAESVDVVISNHALEHALSPFDELRDLARILKPGGKLVVWLPLDDWRAQRKLNPEDVNHHLYAWTPLLLGNLLTEAGFEVQGVWPVTRAWPRGIHRLKRLPASVLEPLSWAWSVAARRRQLRAIALKPAAPSG